MRLLLVVLVLLGSLVADARLMHVIPATTPPNATFSSSASAGSGLSKEEEYSTSHCFSSSQQFDGWRTTACYVKNLCFDPQTKDFVFFAAPSSSSSNAKQQQDEQDLFHVFPPVSIGTFNYKWGNQYDATMRFRPKVVRGPLPAHRRMASSQNNELWIPFLPFCPANIGHLVWDDYLAWFLLSWAVAPLVGGAAPAALRPLWVNPKSNPPWATCDWIREHEGPGHSLPARYSDRCLNNNRRWLPLLIGPHNDRIPETHDSFTEEGKGGGLVCFPHAATGLTAFSNQASGHHGWNERDGPPPAFGRGPLLFEYTRHMMRHIGVEDAAPGSVRELVVFFSSGSSNRVYINFEKAAAAVQSAVPELERLVSSVIGGASGKIKVVVQHAQLAKMTAKEQVELVSTACMYVTAAGGGAFTAQFLPKGSSILLYEDGAGEHLHKGRVDWKFFNAVAWMRPTFWSLKDHGNTEKLLAQVRRELVQCAAFMDVLVAAVDN